jgi:hypothetical protein
MFPNFWMQKRVVSAPASIPKLYIAKNMDDCAMISEDSGDTWTTLGASEWGYCPGLKVFVHDGTIFYVLTDNYGCLYSTDGGANWARGWTVECRELGYDGNYFYSCAPWGVWRDAEGYDPGWSQITGDNCYCFANDGDDYIYIGSSSGVKVYNASTDYWSNNGPSYLINQILVLEDGTVWATTQGGGVAKSTDHGSNWTLYDTGEGVLTNDTFGLCYDENNSRIIVGCDYVSGTGVGLSYSANGGSSWSNWSSIGIGNATRICPRWSNGVIYCTGYGGSTYDFARSDDSGSSWENVAIGTGRTVRYLFLLP